MEKTKEELVDEIRVIHKDPHILVVSKPPGLVVNRISSHKEYSLQDWVEENFRLEGSEINFLKRSGLVHRLDRPTSGLLVIALSEKAFLILQKQFKERQVKKEYLLLAHGLLGGGPKTIDRPLGRDPFNSAKFAVVSGGKVSKTEVFVLARYKVPGGLLPPAFKKSKDPLLTTVTYARAVPYTGRTHQIRVHLKFSGHPLVGDPLYAGRKVRKSDALWCPRLFLHAAHLKIKHPFSGKVLELEDPLPPALERVLAKLSPLAA